MALVTGGSRLNADAGNDGESSAHAASDRTVRRGHGYQRRFYRDLLGFVVERRAEGYASLRRGLVVFGLGPVAKLPDQAEGRGFTRQRLKGDKGAGVEIVLELDGVDEVAAMYERCRQRAVVSESLELRPWGLYDFRLTDPDGYYLRITHGNAAA